MVRVPVLEMGCCGMEGLLWLLEEGVMWGGVGERRVGGIDTYGKLNLVLILGFDTMAAGSRLLRMRRERGA